MKIVITGANGLVGRALARVFRDHDVRTLGHADLDITRPIPPLDADLVFNCAVIGVDDCEHDPALAQAVNVAGPANLAAAAPRIVHFSSNYVFDGRRPSREPYTIEDEARPINVYGETKLAGERAVAERNPRAQIVRTSWVFGEGKQSFLATSPFALRRGERITAITDTFASTTYVEDLAARVREIVERDVPGTYHVVNDGVCSYETFAREAAAIVGAPEALIERKTESQMERAAPRPQWTAMRCLLSERIGLPPMRDWREALRGYVRSSEERG